ncbi:5-formyltetrahydrofolate cyclo-ligase [Chelativorans sp. AA-79]|uniref:5-formyltetrahydrofolate cyclo-ligase n=1 Tax=Chelativorans sp. AA-79 TaxID=3028735 RepID=UPI0023F7DEAC|nr:5-formyltetrahydrofolate cyclo-ligase [Chelativorans sp. AA-79]WEX11997.1 5-formyltetrahydrofolate cyclo-ligase [Chelativorans sp. AA-79]
MSGKRDDDERDGTGSYASPPCYMHELDSDYLGLAVDDLQQRIDVARWRKAERQRLIEERLALSADERSRLAEKISASLDRVLPDVSGRIVSAYWPFRGEPDLRGWMKDILVRGGSCALPVVVERHAPLVFRAWKPGDKLERGIWNILVPAKGEEVMPDVVIAPIVGFDSACYRLGYGGGFFDRTLAAMQKKPHVIGLGYEQAALPTIYPQPHDIPMDVIVTESGFHTHSHRGGETR